MIWDKLILKYGRLTAPIIIEGAEALSMAQSLAKQALCINQNACGDCASCKKFQKGFHPDYLMLSDDAKMEDLRQALSSLRLRPFESRVRVMIIDGLNSHKIHLQNALLKTLEEPSDRWMLILSVESRWSLLETIRSRCLTATATDTRTIDLSPHLEEVFRAVEHQDESALFNKMDSFLKDRSMALESFRSLLNVASQRGYPGHWMSLAPLMEEGIDGLLRNLNQRVVWDSLWVGSLDLETY